MATRRVHYAPLATDEDDYIGDRSRPFDPRFDYIPKALDKVPWKSIVLALFLLFLGTGLLFLSYFIFTGHMGGERSQAYGLLALGFLSFLPGFYETRIAYYAWRGAKGFWVMLSTPIQIQGNASTISESASHASAQSEPVVPTFSSIPSIPSISVASQSPQTAHSFDQNDNLTEVNSPEGMPIEQWASFLTYRLKEETMKMSETNALNRQKQTIPHTLGTKTIARKRHELEIETGRSYSRAEMYSISHKKSDGSFVNEEAKQKSDLLEKELEKNCSEEAAYVKVFRKDRSGYVRGMGFGVCPSQVLESASSSSSSQFAGITLAEWNAMKSELQESNAKFQALEERMNSFMQQFGGQGPPNQVLKL
ncbi:uncharacterized protein LOC130749024 [Lotus japonicus]|uniref:uncharacterized protein LOC130749024 n=1 Tax=Lotus japonicus TaxID=34305 RepID=UPI00258690CB|nr:uncharacterized protein LOC130749024 [Lotus japonicus]XP_057458273.1 uncharacterized protein LOC130749024 [Lotus japonicus]XP_057458274.1 uncharacterized protein LOC130749024 [Lotus japonicus]XP_057458275.1 uncharacterized protein LOC130749024 [Lotus japonicus]XP_057458276.1 uncharacterized protein LOC130749024 [Lotus japonicus]